MNSTDARFYSEVLTYLPNAEISYMYSQISLEKGIQKYRLGVGKEYRSF